MADIQHHGSRQYDEQAGQFDAHYDAEKHIDEKPRHSSEEEDEDDSPFEMVRIAVPNKDDPSLPCLTFRSWVLGIIFAAGLAFINQFYWFRENPITLGGYVVQLLSFPLGYLMALVLPKRKFRTFGWEWTLNPGPFNIKEHVIISIFAGTSVGTTYGIDVVTIKKMWYHSDIGFGPSILFILTSQIMGYSFAGLARKYLVYPAAMIWPANLVSVTLFRTFHEVQNWGRLSRTKVFWLAFIGSFVWYFLPGYAFPVLSFLPILCFAAPNNVIANQLGDASNGVGMLNFSLDWSYISSAYTQSPIAIPWIMACNVFAGFVIIMWIATPIGYYKNTWNTGLMPMYTASLYTTEGKRYNISKIMTGEMLDIDKFNNYSPLRMTFTFAMTYGLSFAGLMNLIVYIALNYGKDIARRVRQSRTMDEDIHMKLMRKYTEVPHWWYLVTFAITFILAIVTCQVWNLMPCPYHPTLYLFIFGAMLPIPFWLYTRKFPESWVKHIHTPLLFIASGYMPPAPSTVYTNWFIGCFFFNYIWHKYRNTAWQRYAFAMSAGLDCGLAISGILIYFAFLKAPMKEWWGNPSDSYCPLAAHGYLAQVVPTPAA
ncbi:OPT superfamily oligopeptide transporter [Martensiomyces pterosporus]|nr:OPT superfamily oligopeptide transporter [Martensiomyces pterosporus]